MSARRLGEVYLRAIAMVRSRPNSASPGLLFIAALLWALLFIG